MDRKISSLLSLCTRAGMLRTGEETAEKLLKCGDAKLVIVANDASDNTQKKGKGRKAAKADKPVGKRGRPAAIKTAAKDAKPRGRPKSATPAAKKPAGRRGRPPKS